MPEDAPATATVVKNDRAQWTNWHQNVTQKIRGLYDVYNPPGEASAAGLRATVRQLQGLIADAQGRGDPVRAIGGGWSFSRVPATEGWVVNTRPLNWVFRITQASVHDGYAGDPEGLLLVQCGVQISELNRYLEVERGRSLRTAGASNGQTFVGAMSTGTHGSAIDEAGIQDHVVGLHVVAGPDRHFWIERAAYPVASPAFVERLGATAIRDDTLFEAAVVSFGGFGIIHAAMIETSPRFLLEAYRRKVPFDDALRRAMTTLDFGPLDMPDPGSRPYFFQVIVDPYEVSPAYVTTMYKRPVPAGYEPDYAEKGGLRPGYDLLAAIGVLNDKVPELTPTLVSQIAKAQLQPFEGKTGTLGETFDFTTPRSSAAGAAIGVRLGDTAQVLDRLLALNERIGPAPIVFACRYVQRSRGLLAFTRFEPTCVIDMDGVYSRRSTDFFRAAWDDLDAAGIPYTQHWGKINALTPRRLEAVYGEAVSAWRDSRRQLLAREIDRRTFANRFLRRAGLHA